MIEDIVNGIIDNILQDRDIRGNSSRWANWMSMLTITTCEPCRESHGKIVDISILDDKYEVNAHVNCKCILVPMRTKAAGTATDMGYRGADAVLYFMKEKELPSYYVDKETAYAAGWKQKHKKLSDALPGKMLGGDVYRNKAGKLPNAPGRVWYEADINYTGGKRNRQRVVYSNDGLVFVTYDHYETFYEITG